MKKINEICWTCIKSEECYYNKKYIIGGCEQKLTMRQFKAKQLNNNEITITGQQIKKIEER